MPICEEVSYHNRGFAVFQASGGCQGFEMFEKHHYSLVFTDLMMPEVSGLAVLRDIKRVSPDTPVVVISGNGSVSYAIEAVRMGAWNYITMPDGGKISIFADETTLEAHNDLSLAGGPYVRIQINDTGCGIPVNKFSIPIVYRPGVKPVFLCLNP